MRIRSAPILSLLLAFAACGPGAETPATPAGALQPAPGSLLDGEGAIAVDFGTVALGSKARRIVLVENRGEEMLQLAALAPEPPFFSDDDVLAIPPGGRASFSLGFLPEVAGGYAQELRLASTGGSLLLRLRGRGEAAPAGCDLELPDVLRFTHRPELGAPRIAALPLLATGSAPCDVTSARLSAGAPYDVETTLPVQLAPGVRFHLQLRFDPREEGDRDQVLTLETSAGARTVRIESVEESACMRSLSPGLSLEGAGHACMSQSALTLENGCAESIELVHAALPEGPFSIEPLPLRLGPHERAQLWIGYEAEVGEELGGALGLYFDNGDALSLPLVGLPAPQTEQHFVAVGTPLDLAVVVDLSEEMFPFQPALAAFAETLDAYLSAPELDLRVGVVTTSPVEVNGCGEELGLLLPGDGSRPRWVEVDTPHRLETLRANLMPGACYPRGKGQPLEAALRAAQATGWRRPGVPLMVLFITADEDASEGELPDYIEALGRLTGFEDEALVRAIVGMASCEGMVVGKRVVDLVDVLFGSTVPICEEARWGEALAPLEAMREMAPWLMLPLEVLLHDLDGDGKVDEGDGLLLRVDGEVVPSQVGEGPPLWRYVFPPEGPAIELSYDALAGSRAQVSLRYPLSCLR